MTAEEPVSRNDPESPARDLRGSPSNAAGPPAPTGKPARAWPAGKAAGEAARERILSAARSCFAGSGFAETSLKSISRKAGVNQAMIHYYFGCKQDLYRQALRDCLSEMVRRAASRMEVGLPPDETLLLYSMALMDALRRSPEAAGLLRHELGRGGSTVEEMLETVTSPDGRSLRSIALDLIRAAQEAGQMRRLPPEAIWRLLRTLIFGGVLLGGRASESSADTRAEADPWEPFLETCEILLRRGLLM